MMYIGNDTIDAFIKEDVPYIDLTTLVLGIGNEKGRITFASRAEIVLSGTEEVMRIFDRLGIKTVKSTPSGRIVKKGEVFLTGEGDVSGLHIAWKIALNILEYSCGIATKTKCMVDQAKAVNSGISLLTTRKSFPGTKELAIKAILAGGAYPHRLGLSETILIFRQHLNFIGGYGQLARIINEMKTKVHEKKIIVEVEKESDAMLMATTDIDGLQFDKMAVDALTETVKKIRAVNKKIILLAAGGINETNAGEYASTGVDALVATSVYFGKPADIKVTIDKS